MSHQAWRKRKWRQEHSGQALIDRITELENLAEKPARIFWAKNPILNIKMEKSRNG